MPKINLTVLSREDAQVFSPIVPTAYVSIYTPDCEPAHFQPLATICGVLKICFDDMSDERLRGERFGEPWNRPMGIISEIQAMEIHNFVQAQIDRGITNFMVHCDAGISRSPGVAAALDVVFNHAENIRPGWERYNRLVYSKVLEAFKGPMVQHD